MNEGDIAGAYIGATAAFYAIRQAVFLGFLEVSGLGVAIKFLRQQSCRTDSCALAAPDTTSLYRSIVSQNECVNLIGDVSGNVPEPWWENQFKRQTAAEDLMYLDTVMYLPDDVLTKVDRCTMSVGLEARVPLLDHRIVEYLWSLPIGMKIRNGTGKFVLRQLLARLLPEELWNRPKMGFSVPVSKWLKGPLQSWADDMLAPTTIKNDGFLNADDVSKLWSQHRSGSVDSPYLLWNILMFQQWLHGLHD